MFIPTENRVTWHKGFLCIAYTTTYTDKPIFCRRYWPVAELSHHDALRAVENGLIRLGAVVEDRSQGVFYDRENKHDYVLKDREKTLPIDSMEYPFPCPKSGAKPTRFYNGIWQKRLKEGWVSLPVEYPSL